MVGGLILVPITLFNCDHAFATDIPDGPTGGWAGGQRCSATLEDSLSLWCARALQTQQVDNQ